jgi:AraC-like DNA-binding protein
MKYYSIFLNEIKRTFCCNINLHKIGHLPHKDYWVRFAQNTFNFGFIVEGNGNYIYQGREYPITAPCVILQRPGEYVEYGPDTWWDEVYFVYDRSHEAYIHNSGLANPDVHVWNVQRADEVRKTINCIYDCVTRYPANGAVDEIDYLVQLLIVQSWLKSDFDKPTDKSLQVQKIQRIIENQFTKVINYTEIAQKYNISHAALWRNWSMYNDLTPLQYQTQLRMREAERLLQTGDLDIYKISELVGYEDAFYFSRRFRQLHGISPLKYRNQHKPK